MPNQNDTKPIARKVLPIIYVLDTSGSMAGDRIAAVNEAMSETMEVLKDISSKNPDAEIKVGVLQFATGADWVTNGLVYLEDFFWNPLTAGGVTDFGSALSELDEKLSRSAYLVSETGFCVPVLMFMSDGMPTDNYEKALDKIRTNNKWFYHATKIGIAVGDAADKVVLAKIVGNEEAVIAVDDVETLKKLIKVASVTSSMISSTSHSTDYDPVKAITTAIKKEVPVGTDPILPPEPDPMPDPEPDPEPDPGSDPDPWKDDPWDDGKWD